MCGRYSLATTTPADVRARFPVGESIEIRQRFNVAPADDVLAVTLDREDSPRGELLRWGLVPSWAERQDIGLKMINARAETVAERPAFRRAFERYRCLILADGFYEWRPTPSALAGRARKQPFHISCTDQPVFAFAGLWSVWHAPEGGTLRSCTILTVAANAAVAPLHDRMPVILPEGADSAWLDPGTPRPEVAELLAPLAPERTALRPVSAAVNDARYDGPECLAPPVASEQTTLFEI
ncbi:MAG: SOS response-associated peptidase [Actinomycetota bacterium]|nr:SOS response-associated peptidase [Actinomycetota bacterium]